MVGDDWQFDLKENNACLSLAVAFAVIDQAVVNGAFLAANFRSFVALSMFIEQIVAFLPAQNKTHTRFQACKSHDSPAKPRSQTWMTWLPQRLTRCFNTLPFLSRILLAVSPRIVHQWKCAGQATPLKPVITTSNQ